MSALWFFGIFFMKNMKKVFTAQKDCALPSLLCFQNKEEQVES
jgi:hypothetical protein